MSTKDPSNNQQVAPPPSANTTSDASRSIVSLLGTIGQCSCYSISKEKPIARGNLNCVMLSNARLHGSSLNLQRCTMLRFLQRWAELHQKRKGILRSCATIATVRLSHNKSILIIRLNELALLPIFTMYESDPLPHNRFNQKIPWAVVCYFFFLLHLICSIFFIAIKPEHLSTLEDVTTFIFAADWSS